MPDVKRLMLLIIFIRNDIDTVNLERKHKEKKATGYYNW